MMKDILFVHTLLIFIPVAVPSFQYPCNRTRVLLANSTYGIITDGPNNYTQDSHCEWLITAPPGHSITLKIDQLKTECSFDYLFIFDGKSYSGKTALLASFSGAIQPHVSLLARSGFMLILLYSDTNYVLEGFKAEYLVSPCPLNCSGVGECVSVDEGFACKCAKKRSGEGCEIHAGKSDTRLLFYHKDSSSGRVGHSAILLGEKVYIYGGFDLNAILGDLKVLDLPSGKIEIVAGTNSSDWPRGRYAHTSVSFENGFFVHGGRTASGISNEFWYFNASEKTWTRWSNEELPKLMYHTMTWTPSGDIYVYGGGTEFGGFSNTLYRFRGNMPHQWTIVNSPCCGRSKDRSILGHTMTYWKQNNALLLFGGLGVAEVGRFSRLSNQMWMFLIESKTWVQFDHGRNGGISSSLSTERAFHTVEIVGDYLIILGGYTHVHNKDETCYSGQMLVYSLKCQVFLPEAPPSKSLEGLFGHKSIAWQNQLIVLGGYRGYMTNLVQSIPLPFTPDPTECIAYEKWRCSGDPRCGWCPTDSRCYEKITGSKNCTTNLQTAQCPGICPRMPTCQACVTPGCIWCDSTEQCGKEEEESRICTADASRSSAADCILNSSRQGVTMYEFRSPANFSQPDHVKIINSSIFLIPRETNPFDVPVTIVVRGSLIGFTHTPKKIELCAMEAAVNLTMKSIEEELAVSLRFSEYRSCLNLTWPSGKPVVLVPDLQIMFELSANSTKIHQQNDKQARVNLQLKYPVVPTERSLKREHLLPYLGNLSCPTYITCLSCLGDSMCAWTNSKCVSKYEASKGNLSGSSTVLLPEECSLCSDINFCSDCVEDPLCEWWEEDVSCIRRGRLSNAVKNISSCPADCNVRKNCSSCLEPPGKCVWCEQKQECFVFSVYTSFYQYGQCFQWLDKAEQCQRCDKQPTCESCILQLGCGWNYNDNGGVCGEGDFAGPYGEDTLLSSDSEEVENRTWTYAECPDVDECELGIHDCHVNATCRNTIGSFICSCKQGFAGDGRHSCEQTCYEPCVHGTCSSHFVCECDLGWTGVDCSIDCGCNNHSYCETGKCDACQGWTVGDHCELCKVGSFGDATSQVGCTECNCNGHGNLSMGLCHPITGHCYCLNNTSGRHCSECSPSYYGNPHKGLPCYRECSGRAVMETSRGYFGLQDGPLIRQPLKQTPIEHCLWIIKIPLFDFSVVEDSIMEGRHIRIKVSAGFHIPCVDNVLMIYSGLPWFSPKSREAPLVAAVCSDEVETMKDEPVEIVVRGDVAVILLQYAVIGSNKLYFNATYDLGHTMTDVTINSEFPIIAQKLYGGHSVLSRFAHSLHADEKNVWIFGGYSLSHGPLNDIRHFSRDAERWIPLTITVVQNEDSVPPARYFHGGALGPGSVIYIHGGISHNYTFLSDVWRFDTRSSSWTKFCDEEHSPRLAGHSLTIMQGLQYHLVVIGGFNPYRGFSDKVYTLSPSECWETVNTTGSSPVGIYGHSTVYHHQTDSFFVFGGILYEVDHVSITSRLYALHWPTKRWSVLPPIEDNQVFPLPPPKLFHSAVTTDSYMVILGGSGSSKNSSLIAYIYQCNLWILLGDGANLHRTAGAASISGSEALLMGGWEGATTSESLFLLSLPKDICSIHNSSERCKGNLGCSYCSSNNNYSQQCYSSSMEMPSACSSGASNIEFWKGTLCSSSWMEERNCNQYLSCTECLAAWPSHLNSTQICQWCTNCQVGRCIPIGKKCQEENACTQKQRETTDSTHCPERLCSATECEKCISTGKCIWTRQILRSSEWSWKLHSQPVYDWNCVRKSILDTSPSFTVISSPPTTCPMPCSEHTNCGQCLKSPGAEGGFHQCFWSVSQNRCISPAHSWLLCFGGLCGPILKGPASVCPKPCSAYDSCSSCLELPSCGWCAIEGGNGEGRCLPGESFSELGSCPGLDWHYLNCPKENECTNNHHTCNPVSEECIDLDGGFRCQCRVGYERSENSCVPICSEGCIHGQCISPGECSCHFSYVGKNCSFQCKCNGHSHCAGVDELDKCLECRNNTMGLQCSECKPMFVGDPKNNGACIPCTEYCNGHSSVCLSQSMFNTWCNGSIKIAEADLMTRILATGIEAGPSSTAFCCFCKNRTNGDTCNDCNTGYFRGSEDKRLPCRKCECHGHGDICNPITGHDCDCGNNTESEHCSQAPLKQGTSQQCLKHQCAKCKDSYLGDPTNGHQCYRQMHVDTKYFFDPKQHESESKDAMKPKKPLLSGRTVFFAVQPKFMNVNIRINLDVTHGAVNVFLSPTGDTFIVRQDHYTWMHHVEFDTKYQLNGEKHEGSGSESASSSFSNQNQDYDSNNGTEDDGVAQSLSKSLTSNFRLIEREAAGFTTYITLDEQKAVLVVRNLRNRLVITLPQESHDLRLTRFYVVLEGVGDVSSGSVFFRQDQLHIDLFVFFSVFFSAFFLFLAACGIAWKVKQNMEARTARHRHVAEMLSMAKRPFGIWTIIMEPDSQSPLYQVYSQCRKTCRKGCICLRPVAVEPTPCGSYGVCTMLVTLAGGPAAPVRLCLASTLSTLHRSHPPLHSRRRRLPH